MTILLIIVLVLLVAYLYWQNQQLKNGSDSPSEQPEPWKEAIAHLQDQINELKAERKDDDEKR